MTGDPPVAVRQATLADGDQVVALFLAVVDEGRWLGTEGPRDPGAERERFLGLLEATEGGTSLVAVAEERVVGHVRVDMAPYRVASFGMVVDAGWRGRGVGRALLAAAVEASRAMGAHKMALQVWPHNDVARRLYRGQGFVEEGLLRRHYRRRNGELWDAVVMGLVLDETSPGPSLPA